LGKKSVSAIIKKIESMPTLPTVAFRVMEVTGDSKSSANDLMKIISTDVSLTAKILKIANSPFYGLTREISSLQHALTVLGFKEIKNLVISTVAVENFKDLEQDGKFDIKKFWKHSFCCGLAAKIIATSFMNKGNELFVAGLLHDIGKLVIYIAFPDEFMKQQEAMSSLKLKYLSFSAEKNFFAMSHDEVGMKLLQRWMFPEDLIAAVGFHHQPQYAYGDQLYPMVVHVADILSHIYEVQAEEDDSLEVEPFYNDIVKLSQLYEINWNVSDISKFQQSLAESMEKEADTMKLFF
jgi:putative nucleotidyltransferase with HDIG domain